MMTLWHRLMGLLFGTTYVRIEGEIYRVHIMLDTPFVYIDEALFPLRSDGSAGFFSNCRWEHFAGPKLS
jgi:hypothetical protein